MIKPGTVNIFEGNEQPAFGLDAVAKIATAFGVQEATAPAIRAQVERPGWNALWPGASKPETLPGVSLPKGWENAANAIPIAYREDTLTAVGAGYFFAHPGHYLVTPHRGTSWGLFEDKDGTIWPVLNWHLISQAWPGSSVVHRDRQARWNLHMRTIDILVARFLKDYGRVVGLGDLNRFNYTFTNGLKNVAVNGLDYIAVAGDIKPVGSRVLIDLHSGDTTAHKGMVIPLSATPKEAPVARSQNGYTANDKSVISTRTIPGTERRIALRKGPTGDLLLHFFAWYDKNVEDIEAGQLDDWGYAERPIRGADDDELSNHASGTAGDMNALKHPLGKTGTFTPAQVEKVHAELAKYEGCIRWGEDYKKRKDGMHFEIVKSEADCARVLKKLTTKEDEMPNPDDLWNSKRPFRDASGKIVTMEADQILERAHANSRAALDGLATLKKDFEALTTKADEILTLLKEK